jgi:hypothetical protein
VPAGQKQWEVVLHREVGKDVSGYALCDPKFTPPLRQLFDALKANPKQFRKKRGKLADARSADLKYGDITFRAVFTTNEAARIVYVLALDQHDVAYRKATRRNNS